MGIGSAFSGRAFAKIFQQIIGGGGGSGSGSSGSGNTVPAVADIGHQSREIVELWYPERAMTRADYKENLGKGLLPLDGRQITSGALAGNHTSNHIDITPQFLPEIKIVKLYIIDRRIGSWQRHTDPTIYQYDISAMYPSEEVRSPIRVLSAENVKIGQGNHNHYARIYLDLKTKFNPDTNEWTPAWRAQSHYQPTNQWNAYEAIKRIELITLQGTTPLVEFTVPDGLYLTDQVAWHDFGSKVIEPHRYRLSSDMVKLVKAL